MLRLQTDEIMQWALNEQRVVLTHDLDFGALLAATQATGPSAVQIRQDVGAGRIDHVVVHRFDRLSRRVVHFAALLRELREHGVALTIVSMPDLSGSAGDALILNLLSSFAEFERTMIRDRLADARTTLKRRGRRLAGAIPYGYVTDPATKQLVVYPAEARRERWLKSGAGRRWLDQHLGGPPGGSESIRKPILP